MASVHDVQCRPLGSRCLTLHGATMIFATLVTVVALSASPQPQATTFYSYLAGEKWEFRVARPDLAQAPAWRATDDAPPLPPRAAIRSARSMLQRLLASAPKWEVHRVSLQPMASVPDSWVYLVEFTSPLLPPLAPGVVGSHIGSQVTLVVLMNGKAVAPVRTTHSR